MKYLFNIKSSNSLWVVHARLAKTLSFSSSKSFVALLDICCLEVGGLQFFS